MGNLLPVSTPFSMAADIGFGSTEYKGTWTPPDIVAESVALCAAYPGVQVSFACIWGIFDLLVSLNRDLVRLGVPFAK